MTTYVLRNGKLVEKNNVEPIEGAYVISDEMAPTRHMADGRYYTSKHRFRAATRAANCVEVGNELETVTRPRKPVMLDRRKRADDIRRAIYEIRNRGR